MKMGMGKGMVDQFNDDEFPVRAPSENNNGMKKQKGPIQMKSMGSKNNQTDDEADMTAFLESNSTLSVGGKGSGTRNPGSSAKGAMMMSGMNYTSSAAPKAMRMSRIDRNSTTPSKVLQNFMHALHNSNVTVHHHNNGNMSVNAPQTNSTIGALLQRFRNAFNQGLHSHSSNSSNSNSSLSDVGNNNSTDNKEGKFPRLSALWDKLIEGFVAEKGQE